MSELDKKTWPETTKNSNKKPQDWLTEETRQKIINILDKKWLIEKDDISKIKSTEDLKKHMSKLLFNWTITKNDYIEIWIEWWAMKLWNYLVLKQLITKEQLAKALKIQHKQIVKEELGLILIEEKFISDFEKFANALEKLWILRLWEYLLWKNKISTEDLNSFIKIQKIEKIPLWKLLVEYLKITIEDRDEAFRKLWIKTNFNDYDINHNH
jgi:hypothetical protein